VTTLDVAHPLHEQQQSFQLILTLEEAGMIDRVSLTLPDDTSVEQAIGVAGFLGEVKRRGSWYIGDELNQSEAMYGEEYAQVAASFGLNEETLLHYKFVALNVPKEIREPNVPFGAHAAVARLEPKEQKAWLKQAAKKGWSERDLRAAMRAKRKDTHPQLPGTEGEEGAAVSADLVEVARAILRDQRPHEDDPSLVILPVDDIARLEAALGGF
jgi:hypothetical protein